MRKAQSVIEYLVLVSVIVAALVAMQVYIKRGMQGRLKVYAEQLTEGEVYSPGATNLYGKIVTSQQEQSSMEDSTSKSAVSMHKVTEITQQTVPFSDEPVRW